MKKLLIAVLGSAFVIPLLVIMFQPNYPVVMDKVALNYVTQSSYPVVMD